jgi:hypothetical protein
MDPRYPIGPFAPVAVLSPEDRAACIHQLSVTPAEVRAALHVLSPAQVDQPYRPGGWTARQVVHHMADSHMNSYVRFRLALTEDTPTIKPYAENRWAELPDARTADPEVSLHLLEALHHRWVLLLKSLTPSQWASKLRHPEVGEMDLDRMVQLYAWHSRHHIAHLRLIKEVA